MPARQLPTSFTATRPLNLAGTAVARGATVAANVAAQVKDLAALVSRGYLIPTPSLYPQTARRLGATWDKIRHFPPYHLSPTELRAAQVVPEE